MREEQLVKRFGNNVWKKMLEELDGCTVGVNEDGSIDYYDCDIEDAYKAINKKGVKIDWD